jgi:hypothetical protein
VRGEQGKQRVKLKQRRIAMPVIRSKKVYHGFVLLPEMDARLQAVSNKFQLNPSEIVRRSLDLALPHFERSNRLPALRTVAAEPKTAE